MTKAMDRRTLKPSKFYNKSIVKFEIISKAKADKNACRLKNERNRMPQRIVGPTQFWKQFRRQAEALEVAKNHSTDVMCTFVYQKEDGCREFIVAHPEVYWWYNIRQPPEERCSYEVIPEGAPSWLYFDLEFMIESNPTSDGPKMTKTLIEIFCAYFLKYWGLPCDETNVVNLDSTTSVKFSRHLIFCMKDIAFRDNLHVGRFVKSICSEIDEYLENSAVVHDILSRHERKELEDLYVETAKQKKKIFVDTGVYTRNRHFRIYKSTKWGKLSNLDVAADSKHKPLDSRRDKELAVFLDSLISYFPNTKDLILLEIDKNETVRAKSYAKSPNQRISHSTSRTSRYPELDKFVSLLIEPGKIRICKHFDTRKLIVYEVIGNRYCANIGRQHKSNNVLWIADLEKNQVFQKCHDEDCADFKSSPVTIPPEICFHIGDAYDDLFLNIPEPKDE